MFNPNIIHKFVEVLTTNQQWRVTDVMTRIKQSFRRKQMLNWYKTANKTKFDDNNYRNWMRQVGEVSTMKEAIYLATEEQLDDLYILREELRLGI